MLGIRSSLLTALGFPHSFSTRAGGEDAPSLLNDAGAADACLYQVTQVHGTHVVVVQADSSSSTIRTTEADALVTRAPNTAVAVRTADCVPILLADPTTGACAAVHAGWRGAVAGVLPSAIDALRQHFGIDPSALVAAIGPHIRVGSFEIGEEVAVEVVRAAGGEDTVVNRDHDKPHGDLALLLRKQLRTAGLRDDSIEDVGGCTFSEPERFFSYRREPGETRRQLSLIQPCANRVTP